jgi:hypothetical protein
MNRVLFLLILLTVGADGWAQFRRNRTDPSSTPSENNLNYTNPTEYTIAGIEVTGLNILDKNAMVSLTGLKVGDKIKIPGVGWGCYYYGGQNRGAKRLPQHCTFRKTPVNWILF